MGSDLSLDTGCSEFLWCSAGGRIVVASCTYFPQDLLLYDFLCQMKWISEHCFV